LLLTGVRVVFSFLWELVKRAWDSSVASMGTTTLAVSAGVVFALYRALIEWRKNGWAGVKNHWGENLKYGLIMAMCWWGLLFSYHLFYRVPKSIRVTARKTKPPSIRPIPLPDGWDKRTPSRHREAINPSQRHLTQKQKTALVVALSPLKGQRYTIDFATNDVEALHFAEDFRETFNNAGWQIVTYYPGW
jgi:hypothetical protein